MTIGKHFPFSFRKAVIIGCFAGLLGAFVPSALASENDDVSGAGTITAQGSPTVHRSQIDAFYAEVYIYTGGSFPTGTDFFQLEFLFDQGNASGYITPIVLEQTSPGVFTVRGIGEGFEVQQSPAPQMIPFHIVEGRRSSKNANYTFGFINAMVNASGAPILTSPGVVDYIVPASGLHGVGGPATTNEWGATEISPTPVVTLDATFGAAGAEYPFTLPYRTYSAFALGIVPAQ